MLLILDRAAPGSAVRAILEAEARSLTELGNRLMIRHKETDRIPIEREEHVDYLFHPDVRADLAYPRPHGPCCNSALSGQI